MPIDFSGMPQGMQFGAAGMQRPGAGGQSQLDDLQRQLMMAQMYGQSPAVIGDLQLRLQNAQRDFGRSQNQGYIQNMMRHRGLAPVGGGSGPGSVDPYLAQLIGAQWGMGGGPIG